MVQGAILRSGDAEGATPRKLPVQQRSRARVERMLSSATALIGEHGSDALRMSDVAQRAGVSIGSLYQFFPDKTAIIGALLERSNEGSRRCIEEGFSGVTDVAGLRTAFADLFEIYYDLFLREPALRDIWSGAQADKVLRELQLAESRKNGALLAAVLKNLSPHADPGEMETRALLVMHLGEEAMRLAISVDPREGRALVDAYKRMALGLMLPPDC